MNRMSKAAGPQGRRAAGPEGDRAAGPQGICQTRVKHRGQQLKLIVESGLAPMSLGNSPVCCLGF